MGHASDAAKLKRRPICYAMKHKAVTERRAAPIMWQAPIIAKLLGHVGVIADAVFVNGHMKCADGAKVAPIENRRLRREIKNQKPTDAAPNPRAKCAAASWRRGMVVIDRSLPLLYHKGRYKTGTFDASRFKNAFLNLLSAFLGCLGRAEGGRDATGPEWPRDALYLHRRDARCHASS